MLAIVLGVAALAIGVYGMLRREADAEAAAEAAIVPAAVLADPKIAEAAVRATFAGLGGGVLNAAAFSDRAKACGLQAGDWASTEKWTTEAFGSGIPLADRIKLMQNMLPDSLWPRYGLRVACALGLRPVGLKGN